MLEKSQIPISRANSEFIHLLQVQFLCYPSYLSLLTVSIVSILERCLDVQVVVIFITFSAFISALSPLTPLQPPSSPFTLSHPVLGHSGPVTPHFHLDSRESGATFYFKDKAHDQSAPTILNAETGSQTVT